MRRLMTCALSFLFALSFSGQANATTKDSAPSGLGLMAPADNLGQDPIVPVPSISPSLSTTTVAQQQLGPLNTVVSSPVDQVALAGGITPDALSTEEESSISALPASPISDLLMWGVAPQKPRPSFPLLQPTRHHGLRRLTAGIIDRTRLIVARITDSAMHFIGTPYTFGGTTAAGGFDCSGYVQHVYGLVGVNLPRTADEQYKVGERVDLAHAKRGDLVFFQTYAPGASHVGIYLGNDEFIDSSSHGVKVDSLHDAYWSSRYIGTERVIGNLTNDHAIDRALAKT